MANNMATWNLSMFSSSVTQGDRLFVKDCHWDQSGFTECLEQGHVHSLSQEHNSEHENVNMICNDWLN